MSVLVIEKKIGGDHRIDLYLGMLLERSRSIVKMLHMARMSTAVFLRLLVDATSLCKYL
jgi:hypothetical protein